MTSKLRDRPSSRTGRPLDLLTCAICFQHLEDPRKLPCGHTFCLRCLERHYASSHLESETQALRNRRLMPCPSAPDCMHITVVPTDGVSGFPADERIAGIKERVVSQMAENILRSMPGSSASVRGSDSKSVASDASSGTTSSAAAGNFVFDSDDDEISFKFERGQGQETCLEDNRRQWSRYANPTVQATYFDQRDSSEAAGSETPKARYTPDRKRVGVSSSFRARRRQVKVGNPTAYDDMSPAQEFLRRQPSRSGSVPLLQEDDKPTIVRGVHLREPLRRSGLHFSSDRTRPASTILEGIVIDVDRSEGDHETKRSSATVTPTSSQSFKYDSPESSAFEPSKMETPSQRYRKEPEKSAFDSGNGEHRRPESKLGRSPRQSHRAETEASPRVVPEEQPSARPSRHSKQAETESPSYHSSERLFGSSRLFSNVTGLGEQENLPETPFSRTARLHRRLPNTPAQSYAERIKAKSRLSEGLQSPPTGDFHSGLGAAEKNTVFEMGSAPQNTTPRYESPFRTNRSSAYSSNQSQPNIPNANLAQGSHLLREARPDGSKSSWVGKVAYPVDSLWNGMSKYLDCSDTSDDSDVDRNVVSVSKNSKDVSSMDKQGDAESLEVKGDEAEVLQGVAKNIDETEISNCNGFELKVDSAPAAEGSERPKTDIGSDVSQQQTGTTLPGVLIDSCKPAAVDAGFHNNRDGFAENGINSHTVHVIDTSKLTVLTVITSDDVTDMNGNTANVVSNETDSAKLGGDLKAILEAARKKYSTCKEPEDVVRKPVLTPVCESEVVLRWRMQRDDFSTPTSMTITSDGSVFIADGSNMSLDYVDQEGTLVHSITGMKPYSVVALGDDANSERIYVGDRKLRTVRVFDSFGCDVSQWESDETSFGWISGIASMRSGKLVILDRERCKIGVFTTGGVRLSEFGAYGTNDKQLCMADFLAVDSRDRVIVADSGNHCLKLFDPNAAGKPICRISQRGSDDGCLLWPKGVAVDERDNIIVADSSNNRVSQFASDGRFIKHLVVDTPKPYHVTINTAAHLMGVTHFALDGFSQVDVYSVENALIGGEDVGSTPAA